MDFQTFDENQSLAMLLDRATRFMGNNLRRIFIRNDFDITVEQWMILLLLWKENGQTQQQIANSIGKDKGTISPQIDGLEKRNIIVRIPDQNDKRQNLIYLTNKGKQLEEMLIPLGYENMQVAQRGISVEDLRVCKEVLCKVCENLKNG